MDLPTFADVVAAAPLVRRHLKPTALIEWPSLSALLGFRFLVKHENHNPTCAFKVRGGVYLVGKLPDEQRRRGVIACTTGNHGQSVAYACRLFGVRCVNCHTLKASNAIAQIGPNLDDLRPPKGLVLDAIKNGRARGNGQMAANLYTGQDAEDVANYVAKAVGQSGQ